MTEKINSKPVKVGKQLEAAFSIIEVVIVTFLFSIILLALLNIFDWHQKVYLLEQADVRSSGSIRSVMMSAEEYITPANAIIASRSFDGQVYVSGSDVVIVQLPAFDNSNQLIVNTFDYALIYKSGSEIKLAVDAANGSQRKNIRKLIGLDISNLIISYNNAVPASANIASLDVEASSAFRGSKTVNTRSKTTIILRNK